MKVKIHFQYACASSPDMLSWERLERPSQKIKYLKTTESCQLNQVKDGLKAMDKNMGFYHKEWNTELGSARQAGDGWFVGIIAARRVLPWNLIVLLQKGLHDTEKLLTRQIEHQFLKPLLLAIAFLYDNALSIPPEVWHQVLQSVAPRPTHSSDINFAPLAGSSSHVSTSTSKGCRIQKHRSETTLEKLQLASGIQLWTREDSRNWHREEHQYT